MKDFILMEAASSSSSKKKYKCPYCTERYERNKLHIHIQNKHEDLIPEGYTALRVAFNTINNKTEGHCIMCGSVTDWNEDKGRYERLCDNPACKEAYKKMCAERNKKTYGTERLQTDPRYAEEVQRKALAGRKIAGTYRFSDGGEIPYLGTYEKKLLEFMDKVLRCESVDIDAPGPAIEYEWEGAKHIYLPDFYYIPYNLLIEIKDGGNNPNNNPAMHEYKTDRQAAKEKAVEKTGKYNYIRLTNNEFEQLLKIMAVLKYNLINDIQGDIVIRINEAADNISIRVLELINLCKKLSKFDYNNNEKTTLSVSEFESSKSGVCYDYVNYEVKKITSKFKTFFTGLVKDKQTVGSHTYLLSYIDEKVYWLEASWKTHIGVYEFDSEDEALSYIVDKFRRKGCEDYTVEYKPGNNLVGVSIEDFIDEMVKKPDYNFKTIRHPKGKNLVNTKFLNEDMSGTIGAALAPYPVPFESNKSNYYCVPYLQNNVMAYGITKDPMQSEIFSVDPLDKGFYKVYKTHKHQIPDKEYVTFKIKDSQKAKELYDELALIYSTKNQIFRDEVYENYIYEKLTGGSKLLSEEQILFDDRFVLVRDFEVQLEADCEMIRKYLLPNNIDILEEQVNELEGIVYNG